MGTYNYDFLSLDIETIPDRSKIHLLPAPKADTRLKDPVKIQASIEKKKAEQEDKMALNPTTGKIASYVLWGKDGVSDERVLNIDNEADEADLIDDLLVEIRDIVKNKVLITWFIIEEIAN